MNPANIVDVLIRDIKERLTLDGKNRVFEEGKELNSEFMKDKAEPEAFTKEFLIDKILDPLELEKLPEKSFETPKGHRSVDYRIKGETGMFLVEAKPLNADLFDKSRDSGVNQIKGLFKLAEVKEHYDFGVATDGLRWVFIDKNKFLQSKAIIGENILKYLAEVKEDLLTPKLRQLFFGCLDRPKAERFDIDERFKDVPYLNGSLFVHTEVERKNIDYKVRA